MTISPRGPHLRESVGFSWTVVIGASPSSGTLILRLRGRLPALIELLTDSVEFCLRRAGTEWLVESFISDSGLLRPLTVFLIEGQILNFDFSTGVSRPEDETGVSLPEVLGVSRPV